MQGFIVALLVLGCSTYAAWTLMPAAGRRALASSVLRLGLPLPGTLARRLDRATRLASGCGCDGCDHAPAKASSRSAQGPTSGSQAGRAEPAPQVIRIHPRVRR